MHCDSHSACVRLVGLLLALVYSPAIVAADDATPTAGLSTTRPADGPAVEVDGGFMVPYTETIPGTNVTFEMVPIPGGEFLLGSPADEPERSEDEGPQVQVRVEPMWVGRCEVTWAEYKAYMATYRAFKSFEQIVNAAATRGGGSGSVDSRSPAGGPAPVRAH